MLTIVVPFLILLLSYLNSRNNLRQFSNYLSLGLRICLLLLFYALVLYFLTIQGYWDTGWASITIAFFTLIAISIIGVARLFQYLKYNK
jgi:hypothetical protein